MGTLQLWVSVLGTERTGWTRVGTSPYLNAQDQPTNYVYSIVKKAEIGDFDFQDTAQTGTINSVTLYVYGQAATGSGQTFYIWDGVTWTSYNPTLPATWGWASIAVPVLNTWAKINGAKLYIFHFNTTARTDVDAAYLLVDYTPPGAVETVVAKDFPIAHLEVPVKAKQLTSKVQGATKTTVSKDFPEELLKSGKAAELKSKFAT